MDLVTNLQKRKWLESIKDSQNGKSYCKMCTKYIYLLVQYFVEIFSKI